MSEIITIGLDLPKNMFQVHRADAVGQPVLRKKLRRGQVLAFFIELQPCVVAMEACGGAHYRGRQIGKLGNEVRPIPPGYVKPFVKRQKNDAADAEAICEAVLRPTMRFVLVKSEETQGAVMVFRVRELLIRQRTQAINALRGHLAEFGEIVPQWAANASKLIALFEGPECTLPSGAIPTLKVMVATLTQLEEEITKLDAEMARRVKENEGARRLMTVPGIGPLIATAPAALVPPPDTFRRARDFAAWLGPVPRQHSTGGKQRIEATTEVGERSLRRLLIIGANSVIIKRHTHASATPGTWLGGMLSRKPPMLVRVALANKMARIVWALMARAVSISLWSRRDIPFSSENRRRFQHRRDMPPTSAHHQLSGTTLVEYFHVVFTLPAEIAQIAFWNKKVVYGLLFKASAEAVMTIAADPKRLGARIGMTSVLHTWGRR